MDWLAVKRVADSRFKGQISREAQQGRWRGSPQPISRGKGTFDLLTAPIARKLYHERKAVLYDQGFAQERPLRRRISGAYFESKTV